MAKKSRLGKGVGALFPTLPTFEENAGDVSFNEGQKHGFEGKDASDSPKRLHGKDTSYSNGQNVSRETFHGDDASAEADSSDVLSRIRVGKRRMPSLAESIHPSNFFFEASGVRESDVAADSEQLSDTENHKAKSDTTDLEDTAADKHKDNRAKAAVSESVQQPERNSGTADGSGVKTSAVKQQKNTNTAENHTEDLVQNPSENVSRETSAAKIVEKSKDPHKQGTSERNVHNKGSKAKQGSKAFVAKNGNISRETLKRKSSAHGIEPSVNNDEERTQHNREGQAQHNSIHGAGESSQEIKQESANPKNKGKVTGARLSCSATGKVKAEKDKQLTDNGRDKTNDGNKTNKDKQDKPLGSADKESKNSKTPVNRSEQGNPDQLLPVQGGYLAEIPISEISPNEKQPRTVFDDGELRELADSIKEVGVLQPVVVRRRGTEHDDNRDLGRNKRTVQQPDGDARKQDQERSRKYMRQEQDRSSPAPQYELIMGERRLRASILAGLKTIPAIVKTATDDSMLRDALLENLHRVALNPLEEAAAYQQMMEDFGLTQEQLSKSISKSRPQIANTLRLLQLPASVQKKVASGVLSAGHARALLSLSSSESMEKLATQIVAEGLSVRSTEELVVMQSHRASQKKHKPSQNVWASAPEIEQLSNYFDTKVDIKGTSRKGRIEITFTSQEDLHRIISVIQQGSGQQDGSQGQSSSQGTADGWF